MHGVFGLVALGTTEDIHVDGMLESITVNFMVDQKMR